MKPSAQGISLAFRTLDRLVQPDFERFQHFFVFFQVLLHLSDDRFDISGRISSRPRTKSRRQTAGSSLRDSIAE